ncbi:hypothetical protein ACXYMO_16615 [Arenibacterium sp. CAU 1754]
MALSEMALDALLEHMIADDLRLHPLIGRLDTPDLFLSNRLKAAIDEAGLRIPKNFKMKVA